MAKIKDLLKAGRTFSFELMPPRTPEREIQLDEALGGLEPLHPSFVSITYGAAGSTRDKTHALVRELLQRQFTSPMAHLTCAAHSRAELVALLQAYADDGLQNILALYGDPPLSSNATELPEGELTRASQLMALAREVGNFSVGVAAHPEGHPKAPDRKTDRQHQADKIRDADFAITQFFFRSSDYFGLVEDLAKLGVTTPIIPGILPPTNFKQLDRMAEMSGADVPQDVRDQLAPLTEDPRGFRSKGVEIATKLSQELLDGGAPGLHFYTMNRSTATREIYANLGLRPSTVTV
jgi:methylenetetrahydrofolate reductase (NADPH)